MSSEQHYVLGYGSLMSHDSRFRYSNINSECIPVILKGWQRGWVTACPIENFTSVGATQNKAEEISAMLVPVDDITPELQNREKNYRFSSVERAQIQPFVDTQNIPEHAAKFWVCEVLKPSQACHQKPIYQSYVDTCMVGCLESANEEFAMHFIETTFGWDKEASETHLQGLHWINDRHSPRYPRAANVSTTLHKQIDQLLEKKDILQHRYTGH